MEFIKEARRKTQPKSFIVDIDSIYPSYETFILNKRQQALNFISIAIYNKFKEHNIGIPFPQQDVYIKDFPKPETDNDK